jgi:uncharacterized protein (DUF2147 family)
MFKNTVLSFLILISTVSILSFTVVKNNPDAIVGSWKTGDGTGIIQIFKNGDKYQGKITWLKEPTDENGKPKTDKNHPDEKNHARPVLGLVNMWGFKHNGEKEWTGGKIYDPQSGKTYSCKITLENANTLKLRGYIGVSLLGRTDTWTRQ